MKSSSRRRFIKKTSLAAAALPLISPLTFIPGTTASDKLRVHIFSKHLQFLDYQAVAEQASIIGFDGIDLTVRPGGHVLPGAVHEQLPMALEAIKRGGSSCNIITTTVRDAGSQKDLKLLTTASEHGIVFYRTDWFHYEDGITMQDSLKKHRVIIQELALLNKSLGLVGCYENHAGLLIGASPWEVLSLMEGAEQGHFGVQYDIRHAYVEGGLSWENGLRLLKDHIKNITLKDFKWEKMNGQWQPVNTPIGEGQVDFKKYFGLLKKYGIMVPAILHMEYGLGGAENGNNRLSISPKVVYDAMTRDLNAIHTLWAEA